MSRGFASNYRIVLLASGLIVCFTGLAARLVCLHVIDRDQLLRTIVKTRRQVTVETARRGDIRDARNAILATSRSQIVVAVDPMMFRAKDEEKLPELAQLLGMPLADVRRIVTTRYRNVTVAKSAAKPASEANDSGPALNINVRAATTVTESTAVDSSESVSDPEFARAVMVQNGSVPAIDPDAAKSGDDDDTETEGVADPQGRRAIRWAKLSDHVSEATYAEIEKLGIVGLCSPERRYSRVYPHNELAAHLVGYANREGTGAAGIEAYADFYLHGQNGWREGEKDGRRRELAQFETRSVPRADGYTVILSIDSLVQDIIERELEQVAKTYQPLKATIIVSNPRTGFILGMANYPTFNPNEYNKVPKDEANRMKNVAVSDVYEPGSVFKIVAASAALQEGAVNLSETFNCTADHIVYEGTELKLPNEDHHFDHNLNLAEIIAHSSNRGAAQLAMRIGEERFEKYARAFGFGQKLGFPVGGEVRGIFRPHEQWKKIDFTRIPMGQSIAATALQMHQAMSAIANGGVLLRPQIISEIRDPANNVVYRYAPTEIDRAVSEKTAHTVAELLRGVASPMGTAPEAAIKINGVDYQVAGKTGTAQKYMPELQPSGRMKIVASKKHHVVSFVGFFPANPPPDGRQVAISVIVDDADAHAPNGVAYGAKVAAPVFKSIGEKLIPILSITAPNQTARLDFVAANEGGHR